MQKINLPLISIILSLLPLYGYLVAYGFEVGYLGSYGIPLTLTQVTINAAALATVYFSFISFIFLYMIGLLRIWSSKFKDNVVKQLLVECIVVTLIFLSITILLFPNSIKQLLIVIPLAVLVVPLSDVIPSMIQFRSHGSFIDKISMYRKKRSAKGKRSDPLSLILDKGDIYFRFFAFTVVMAMTSYLFPFILGSSVATGRKYYPTFTNDVGNYALIRSYGNEKISVKFDGDQILFGEVYVFDTNGLLLKQAPLKLPPPTQHFLLDNY